MKQKRNTLITSKFASLIVSFILILSLSSIPAQAAGKIGLSKTSVSIYKGKTYKLSMRNLKKGTKVTWRTSKSRVAAIKASGASCTITGRASGTAVVRAKIGSKTYSCKVTVKKLPVALSSKKQVVNKGSSFTLTLNNTTSNAKWRVSDSKLLKLKKLAKNKYRVMALKSGTAKVYAKLGSKTYTCTVTVKVPAPVAKVPSCLANQTVYVTGSSYNPYFEDEYVRSVTICPSNFIFIKNLDKNAKVTDVKSSNPKLLATKQPGMDAISLEPNFDFDADDWEGPDLSNISSVISFKIQQNNKTYSLSCRITTKPAASPVSSFQIGSRNIAKYYDKCIGMSSIGARIEGKQKVSIKMAPGYVLDSITLYTNGRSKKVSNGATVDFPAQYDLVVLYHTTKKPVNYIAPARWSGKVPSPLHGQLWLSGGLE